MPSASEARPERVTLKGVARFVSDLHLQVEAPAVIERFKLFLQQCGEDKIDALFILGDLFEYWIGDDCADDPFICEIGDALRMLSNAGVRLFFVAGNRDFLLGPDFAARCGLVLLADGVTLVATPQGLAGVAGETTLRIMHGDTLCTDDLAYQRFRTMVRDPQWQASFLGRPLADRLAEVARLRQQSREAMQTKSAEIMDVNSDAVEHEFRVSHTTLLVHGHTHRPQVHTLTVDNHACQRWVLSDWGEARADAIEFAAGTLRRIDLLTP